MCVHVCWFLELKKTWLIDHSRNFMKGIWDSVFRASHVPWDALKAPSFLSSPQHVALLPAQLRACPQISCGFVFRDYGRPAGWWEGSQSLVMLAWSPTVSPSPSAGTITHSDLISGLVTEPHTGKLQQEGPEPTEQDLVRCYWGQRSEYLMTFWPAGHHTTLVWFQGTNPLKWLISFFPQSKFFTNQTWNLENITELLGILIVT